MAADYTGTRQPQTSQGNPALLHKLLGVGLVIMAVAMVIARHAVGDSPDGSNLPAYAIAGVSAVMLGAALMFLKPLVPRRRAGQTVAAYWADPVLVPKALRVWFILEGAGVLASISYFLGGGAYALVVIAAAAAAYWMNGPAVFESE
ncbi:MAG TPA: hypothetical protein VFO21_10820 [Vicinamibacterales bacterium]|nr:hypothetical protein [Vicinamibacterales bacterium]